MVKTFQLLKKALRLIIWRFRNQGVGTTLIWFYGRGLPLMTGIPVISFSRITPQLYVGPQYNAAGKRKLERLGIHGDVNLRREFDDAAHGLALEQYCYLPTTDDHAPTIAHLEEGISFIEEIVATGGQVYIHCAGGIGRAPTMAAAYLISQGMSLDQSVALIKQTRPFIKITPPQLDQLQRLEQKLQASSSLPSAK